MRNVTFSKKGGRAPSRFDDIVLRLARRFALDTTADIPSHGFHLGFTAAPDSAKVHSSVAQRHLAAPGCRTAGLWVGFLFDQDPRAVRREDGRVLVLRAALALASN